MIKGLVQPRAESQKIDFCILTKDKKIQSRALEIVEYYKQHITYTFGQALSKCMEQTHMTIATLSAKTGISERHIGRMRRDEAKDVSFRTIIALCIALNLALETAERLLNLKRFTLNIAQEATLLKENTGVFGNTFKDVDTNAYFFQQTVNLDFDIIDVTFSNGSVDTVIPVVSNPIDVIPDATPPVYTQSDKKPNWWLIIAALILLVVLILSARKIFFITAIISLCAAMDFSLLRLNIRVLLIFWILTFFALVKR